MTIRTPRAKTATQDRSRQSRDRILAAMDQLLQKNPISRITIADLAKRARVSPATIHQRFSNKDAVLSVLIELYIQRSFDWARSEDGRIDWRNAETLEAALLDLGRSAWRQVQALSHIMRPAYLYARLRPDLLADHWSSAEAAMIDGFTALMNAHHNELGGRKPRDAAIAIGRLYNMMTLAILLHDENQDHTEETFAQELGDFAIGYLALGSSRRNGRRRKPAP